MNALRKKIERRINEELKKREQAHFEMVQKYDNAWRLLENQQRQERNKME